MIVIDSTTRLRAQAPGLVLALAAFLTQFDITAVVVAMPAIGQDLDLGLAGIAWVMDAYSLAFTAALLGAGALSDRVGRRRAMLAGNALFVAASLACAGAWDGPTLCAARAAQGAGAAFAVTGAIALIAGIYPDATARAAAFGRMGIVSGVAMAIGPTLGGAIATLIGWRWIFLANLAPCLMIAWTVPQLVAESRGNDGRSLDIAGIALLTSALGCVVAALLRSADAPVEALCGFVACAGLGGLFAWQQRRCPTPMFDDAVFAKPAMVAVIALLLAVSVGYWAILVYLPLLLAAVFAWPAQTIGMAMMAATLPMLVVPLLGGRMAARHGWRTLFAAGLALIATGNVLLAAISFADDDGVRLALAVMGMTFIGSGAALAHPQLSGAVLALIPPAQAGMASAITVAARQAGFAIGIAALGAMLAPGASAAGFARLFLFAALAAAAGLAMALRLLPQRLGSADAPAIPSRISD